MCCFRMLSLKLAFNEDGDATLSRRKYGCFAGQGEPAKELSNPNPTKAGVGSIDAVML